MTPDDVYDVFIDVTSHRVILSPDARMEDENEISILTDILDNKVQAPQLKQS